MCHVVYGGISLHRGEYESVAAENYHTLNESHAQLEDALRGEENPKLGICEYCKKSEHCQWCVVRKAQLLLKKGVLYCIILESAPVTIVMPMNDRLAAKWE